MAFPCICIGKLSVPKLLYKINNITTEGNPQDLTYNVEYTCVCGKGKQIRFGNYFSLKTQIKAKLCLSSDTLQNILIKTFTGVPSHSPCFVHTHINNHHLFQIFEFNCNVKLGIVKWLNERIKVDGLSFG